MTSRFESKARMFSMDAAAVAMVMPLRLTLETGLATMRAATVPVRMTQAFWRAFGLTMPGFGASGAETAAAQVAVPRAKPTPGAATKTPVAPGTAPEPAVKTTPETLTAPRTDPAIGAATATATVAAATAARPSRGSASDAGAASVKPRPLAAARDGRADDLTAIKGLGPRMQEALNRMGVFHLDQIAGWSRAEALWMDTNIPGVKGRVTRDNWIAQAQALLDEKRSG